MSLLGLIGETRWDVKGDWVTQGLVEFMLLRSVGVFGAMGSGGGSPDQPK